MSTFNKIYFSTNGTWVCPSGVTEILIIAAGGGGGGSGAGIKGSFGGSGGGGSLQCVGQLSVTPGATYNITVGAGGIGGLGVSKLSLGNAGSAGGDTIFANNSLTPMFIARGAGAGTGGTNPVGGTNFRSTDSVLANSKNSNMPGGGGDGGPYASNGLINYVNTVTNSPGSYTGGIVGQKANTNLGGGGGGAGPAGNGGNGGNGNAFSVGNNGADANNNTGAGGGGGGVGFNSGGNGGRGGSGYLYILYIIDSGSGGFTPGGDLTGTSTSQTVSALQGSTLLSPASAGSANKVLHGDNGGVLNWTTVNLTTDVSGVLSAGNQAAQSLGGDLSGTTAAATVAKLHGYTLSSATPNDGYVLSWNAINNNWQPTPPSSILSEGKIYEFGNIASDIAGYFELRSNATGVEADLNASVTSGSGQVLIKAFASNIGSPNVTYIPAGIWEFDTYRYVSSTTGTTNLVYSVFIRTAGGSESSLFNVTSGDINDLTVAAETITYSYPFDTIVNATDRIVIKVYAQTTSGSSITTHFVCDGYTHASHVHTPIVGAAITLGGDLTGNTGNATVIRLSGTGSGVNVPSTSYLTFGTTTASTGDVRGGTSISIYGWTGAANSSLMSWSSGANLNFGDTNTQTISFTSNTWAALIANSYVQLRGGFTYLATSAGLSTFRFTPDATNSEMRIIQSTNGQIVLDNSSSGAGGTLTIQGSSAFAGSNANGGNIVLTTGTKDGTGHDGYVILTKLAGLGSGYATISNTGVVGFTSTISGGAITLAGDVNGLGSSNKVDFLTGTSGFVTIPNGSYIKQFDATGFVAATGTIRTAPTFSIVGRNSVNSLDIRLLSWDGTNNIQIGETSGVGQLFLYSNALFQYTGVGPIYQDATTIYWRGGSHTGGIVWDFSASPSTTATIDVAGTFLLTQATRITDAATHDLTFTAQAPYSLATGTNRKGGNFIINLAAPTNGLITQAGESTLSIQRGGTTLIQMGAFANTSVYGTIWLGNNTPSTTNYTLISDGTALEINSASSIAFETGGTGLVKMIGASGLFIGGVVSTTAEYYFDFSSTAIMHFGVAATTATIKYDKAASGAGSAFTIIGQDAATGSNANGGNIFLTAGSKDGSGIDGYVNITKSLVMGSAITSSTGDIRVAATFALNARNAANTVDLNMISIDGANNQNFGSSSGAVTVNSSSLNLLSTGAIAIESSSQPIYLDGSAINFRDTSHAQVATIDITHGVTTFGKTADFKAHIGPLTSFESTYGALWLLPSATSRTTTNCIVSSDGSSAILSTVVNSATIYFYGGNSTLYATLENTNGFTFGSSYNAAVRQVQSATGAGTALSIVGQAAKAASNTNGGNLVLQSGAKDGTGKDGYVYIESGSTTTAYSGVDGYSLYYFGLTAGLKVNTRTITTTYTVDSASANDMLIGCSFSTPTTVTLPTCTPGRLLMIADKANNFATNNLTLQAAGTNTIQGGSAGGTKVISSNGWSGMLVGDASGTNWLVF